MRFVSQEMGFIDPKGRNPRKDVFVVVFVAVVALVDVGLEHLFPKIALFRILEERQQAGFVDREDPLAFKASLLGGVRGSLDDGRREPGKIFGLVDDEGEGVRFLEDVLSELEGQNGELLIDIAELGFLSLVEIGASPNEIPIIFFEKPRLFRRQSEPVFLLVNGFDPGEQRRVHVDVVAEFGHHGRDFLGDRLYRVVRVRRLDDLENQVHLGQERSASFQSFDGVGESRSFGRGDDDFDFSLFPQDAFLDSRNVVLLTDLVERRRLEGGAIGGKEGIRVGGGGSRLGFSGSGILWRTGNQNRTESDQNR